MHLYGCVQWPIAQRAKDPRTHQDLVMIPSPVESETKVENPEQQGNKSRLEEWQEGSSIRFEIQDQSQR